MINVYIAKSVSVEKNAISLPKIIISYQTITLLHYKGKYTNSIIFRKLRLAQKKITCARNNPQTNPDLSCTLLKKI